MLFMNIGICAESLQSIICIDLLQVCNGAVSVYKVARKRADSQNVVTNSPKQLIAVIYAC